MMRTTTPPVAGTAVTRLVVTAVPARRAPSTSWQVATLCRLLRRAHQHPRRPARSWVIQSPGRCWTPAAASSPSGGTRRWRGARRHHGGGCGWSRGEHGGLSSGVLGRAAPAPPRRRTKRDGRPVSFCHERPDRVAMPRRHAIGAWRSGNGPPMVLVRQRR
jgi:hypothetical protein